MEMNVVLRTVLRDVTLEPTTEPAERWHSRGVANAPGRGGLAVVHRRTATTTAPPAQSAPPTELAPSADATPATEATSRGAHS
jgi:hypothetical protein